MNEIGLPFPYKIEDKKESRSFYVSYLIRTFVIRGEQYYGPKVTLKAFRAAMKELGWDKKRIRTTWRYIVVGQFFQYVDKDYCIMRGKEKVMGEKGFLTKLDGDQFEPGYYNFSQYVTEMYSLRPVSDTDDFKDEFKFKSGQHAYNTVIYKRSCEKKAGRGVRKIADQSGCTKNTVTRRLKKSSNVEGIHRYKESNGFRKRKTNLYFSNIDIVYIRYYYNKNNATKSLVTQINSDQNSLMRPKRAIFAGESRSLLAGDDAIYEFGND